MPPPTDEAAVDEADEQDEEADADDDRLLELERDGLEDRLAEAGEHEDRDGDTLEDDEAHGALEGEALAEDEAEGDDRVEAHAGRDGVGTVGDQAHEDGHDAGDEAGRGERGRERQAFAAEPEDARVHEDDVGHDDEGREPGERVALERRVPLLELEEALQRVGRAGVATASIDFVLLQGGDAGARTGRVYRTAAARRYGHVRRPHSLTSRPSPGYPRRVPRGSPQAKGCDSFPWTTTQARSPSPNSKT